MYRMYTNEGDDAVSAAIYEVMELNTKSKGGKLDAYDIFHQIQLLVKEKGKGQFNRSKFSEYDDNGSDDEGQAEEDDLVEGFEEVTDTVVRDNILDEIEPKINEYNEQNGYNDEEVGEDEEDYEECEVNDEESDSTKRKRQVDDLENSKPTKTLKL